MELAFKNFIMVLNAIAAGRGGSAEKSVKQKTRRHQWS